VKQLLFLFLLVSSFAYTQCNQYQIYESFTSTVTTQGGTWAVNSMIAVTSPVRTGTHAIGFNGTGDWIRTPQIANPGVLTFWYRRSSNTTAWTLNIQTSPDGTTWTTRGSITTVTNAYAQYTLNIGALGLTNVFIRLLDARASGAHERYIDDFGLTSTSASSNTLIPILSACSQTLNSALTYRITDDGGPAGPTSVGYTNSVDRILTLTPSDVTQKLNLSFTQLDLETTYDFLYVYDGANTSAPLLATLNGSTLPADIMATNSAGQLTLRWTTDISNVGTWGGFFANATSVTALPVELLYFEGVPYPAFNMLKWATASEKDASHFVVERSADGEQWIAVGERAAAGNSTQTQNYSYLDVFNEFNIHYYRLMQYDIDGALDIYGPIAIDNTRKTKQVVKWVNSLGQKVGTEYKGLVFEIYEDGTSKKIIR
jgi:hypothetical protein